MFVVFGRDQATKDAMFAFLRALGLRPLEWSQAVSRTRSAAPYVGEILDAAFAEAQAVLVLLTPDDVTMMREELQEDTDPSWEKVLTGQARPNVLFEAGMAFGRHDRRTLLVEFGQLRPFSDVAGRHVLRFDGTIGRRQELAQRLRDAGCDVDMDGQDWHTVGDFPYGQKMPSPTIRQGEADQVGAMSADTTNLPLGISVAHAGLGRYEVTIINEGSEPIVELKIRLDDDAPFYLFARDEGDGPLSPGGTVRVTLAAFDSGTTLEGLALRVSARINGEVVTETPQLTYTSDQLT